MSFIVKSRAATLAEVVPNAPARCPACHRKVRAKFTAFYSGDPTRPETVALAAWRCNRCGKVHALMSEPLRPIPCVRPGCGHDTEQDHSADAAADDRPCMVDGCGCPGAVFDDDGFFQWLRQHDG